VRHLRPAAAPDRPAHSAHRAPLRCGVASRRAIGGDAEHDFGGRDGVGAAEGLREGVAGFDDHKVRRSAVGNARTEIGILGTDSARVLQRPRHPGFNLEIQQLSPTVVCCQQDFQPAPLEAHAEPLAMEGSFNFSLGRARTCSQLFNAILVSNQLRPANRTFCCWSSAPKKRSKAGWTGDRRLPHRRRCAVLSSRFRQRHTGTGQNCQSLGLGVNRV
jgi:hypothetical protein